MKPPLRTKSVSTKVSEEEFVALENRARGAGMRLAEWVREALLCGGWFAFGDDADVEHGDLQYQQPAHSSQPERRGWLPL